MILPKKQNLYCLLCQILEKTARQYFKTERVVSLKIISHGASFISDHSIVPSSSITVVSDDYSDFFLIQEYLQYLV